MKNKKGNVAVTVILIVIVAITAGIIGWMFAKKSQVPAPISIKSQKTQPQAIQQKNETADWKIYTSSTFNFSVSLPKDWKAVYPNDGTLYDLSNDTFNNERPEYGLLAGVSSPDKEEGMTFTNFFSHTKIDECTTSIININDQNVKEIICPPEYEGQIGGLYNYEFVDKNLFITLREKTITTDEVMASIKF